MKLIIFFFGICISLFAQKYQVEKVTGEVRVMTDSKNWIDVQSGMSLPGSSILQTGNGGSVTVNHDGISFTLRPVAALPVSTIKHLTIDELLLALAMEEVLSAPGKGKQGEVKNLAVYGSPSGATDSRVSSLGKLRMNGAIQLAQGGFEQSAIATAKEVMRKYPETRYDAAGRLFFADIMYKMVLANEAYSEYSEISALQLQPAERELVKSRMNELKKKLSSGKK